MEKRIAEIGAPVATEKPAEAPPVIEKRSQARSFFGLAFVRPLPIAAPICTDGPSVPSGMPIMNDKSESKKTPTVFFSG